MTQTNLLITSTSLVAAVLLGISVLFIWSPDFWRQWLRKFPRSEQWSWLTMGAAGLWFLSRIWALGPEDWLFGPNTRFIMLLVFGVTWVGSFVWVKDFLAVRGLCALFLLSATDLLASAWGLYEIPSRLWLVSFVYVVIVLTIWVGMSPFRMRDFVEWLDGKCCRAKLIGGILGAYGIVLAIVAVRL